MSHKTRRLRQIFPTRVSRYTDFRNERCRIGTGYHFHSIDLEQQMETAELGTAELDTANFDLGSDVAYWISEVEEELRELDRTQHQLLRERTKYEGTLLWLKNLHQSE